MGASWLFVAALLCPWGAAAAAQPRQFVPESPTHRTSTREQPPNGRWVGRAAGQATGQAFKSAEAILEKEDALLPLRFDLDPNDPASQKRPTVLQLFSRAVYLSIVFFPVVVTALFALLSSSFREPYWFRMIACAISQSGAAFIKWGQWASTRPDMFPDELCNALAMLHSSAPTHSFEFSKRAVESALGRPLNDTFESFDEAPIASGSIAQIHAAVMDGRKVAIKVRHPGVAEQIDQDFRLMRKLASIADNTPGLRYLNLGHSMDMFSHTLASQTRLDVEGAHLMLLNENFKRWKNIGFPHPIFMSDGVLIETFEDGVVISDYIERYSKWREDQDCEMCGHWSGGLVQVRKFFADKITRAWKDSVANARNIVGLRRLVEQSKIGNGRRRPPISYEVAHFIVSTGEDLYLKMLLVDNLMHADLHPGNILINTADGSQRLTLVDAGMVAKLTDEERENFIGLLESLGEGDGRRAAGHILQFSVTQTCKGQAAEAFTRDVEKVFSELCRGYDTGVDVGEVLRSVLRVVRTYGVRVDVNYATLLINLLCLEGLAGALEPAYNILDRAKPLLVPHSLPLVRPVFRRLFPFLVTAKKRSDDVWFRVNRGSRPQQPVQTQQQRHPIPPTPTAARV